MVKVPGERRWTAVPACGRRKCTPDEIARLFHQAQHDVARASDPATDLAEQCRAASAASLGLAAVVLRAWDYETVPPLDPKSTFGALPEVFGPEGREPAATFLSHQRKSRRRNWTARQSRSGGRPPSAFAGGGRVQEVCPGVARNNSSEPPPSPSALE